MMQVYCTRLSNYVQYFKRGSMLRMVLNKNRALTKARSTLHNPKKPIENNLSYMSLFKIEKPCCILNKMQYGWESPKVQ